jgi:hypothetical protein
LTYTLIIESNPEVTFGAHLTQQFNTLEGAPQSKLTKVSGSELEMSIRQINTVIDL